MNMNVINSDLISVIIPCFNSQDFLENCYRSINHQKNINLEIVFVNDGSEDETLNLIEKIQILDDRVVVCDLKKNTGTFNARKQGFLKSSGKYIVYIDPDDCLREGSLDILHNEARLSNSDIVFFGLKRIPSSFFSKKIAVPRRSSGENVFINVLKKNKSIPYGIGGKFYKREILSKAFSFLDFVDKRFVYAEDALLFTASLFCTKSISGINQELYIYNVSVNSITATKNIDNIIYNIDQIKFALKYMDMLKFKDDIFNTMYLEIIKKSLLYDIKILEKRICAVREDDKEYFLKSLDLLFFNFRFREFFKFLLFISSLGKIKFP